MLFIPIGVGIIVAVLGAVAFAVLFVFIPLASKEDNRFGVPSPTRSAAGAVARAVTRTFDFSGRANRKDFWTFAILMAVLAGLALPGMLIIGIWTANADVDIEPPLALGTVLAFLVVAGLAAVACLSMAVRRLHDVNRSGWWILLLCVFGYVFLLYWFLQPSVRAADEDAQVFT